MPKSNLGSGRTGGWLGVETSFWSCFLQLHHHHQTGSQVWLQCVRVLVLQLVCTSYQVDPMQPQPPKYPPPPRAVDANFFVLKTHIAAGNTLPAVKEEEEGSAASSSATAKAPAVPMQPPTSTVPKGPISQFLQFLDWGSPESHLHHHWFPNQILMWSLLLAGNQRW